MHRFLLFLLVLFVPAVSLAQTDVVTNEPESVQSEDFDLSQAVIVATINLQNGNVTELDIQDFLVTFDIFNEKGVQPDIRYAVQLLKENIDGSEVSIDTKVYPEVLSIGEGQVLTKSVLYTPPAHLNGSFKVRVLSSNSNGLPFGQYTIGEIELNGDENSIKIAKDSCYLLVSGETKQYPLTKTVDITAEEVLSLTCSVVNNTSSDVSITPDFSTRYRSSFGEVVGVGAVTNEPAVLVSGETKPITVILPKASVAQVYDLSVVFITDLSAAADSVDVSYVLRGASATIQNLILNKSVYQAGETMVVTFMGALSSDGFPGARLERTTVIENPIIHTTVTSHQGELCSDETLTAFDVEKVLHTINILLKNDCQAPQVSISIKDATNNILATDTFVVDVDVEKVVEENILKPIQEDVEEDSNLTYIFVFVVGLLAIIGLLLLLLRLRKNSSHIDSDDATGPPVAGLAILAVFSASAFMAVDTVEAYTAVFGSYTYTVNINSVSVDETADLLVEETLYNAATMNQIDGSVAEAFKVAVTATTNALTYPCPLDPSSPVGRVLVNFDYVHSSSPGSKYLQSNTLANSVPSEPVAGLMAGDYDITLVSWDSRTGRAAEPAWHNPNEEWHLELMNGPVLVGTSDSISDLLDGVEQTSLTEKVNLAYSLSTNVTDIKPVHSITETTLPVSNSVYPICAAFDPVPPAVAAAPEANIYAYTCNIAVGDSTCLSSVAWNSIGLLNTDIIQDGVSFSNQPYDRVDRSLGYGTHTFNVLDSGFGFASDSVTIGCVPGSGWSVSGNQCIASPTVLVTADKYVVKKGDSVNLSIIIDAPSNTSCSVQGATNFGLSLFHTGSVNPASYPISSKDFLATQDINVSCSVLLSPSVTGSSKTRIEVVGSQEEL